MFKEKIEKIENIENIQQLKITNADLEIVREILEQHRMILEALTRPMLMVNHANDNAGTR